MALLKSVLPNANHEERERLLNLSRVLRLSLQPPLVRLLRLPNESESQEPKSQSILLTLQHPKKLSSVKRFFLRPPCLLPTSLFQLLMKNLLKSLKGVNLPTL